MPRTYNLEIAIACDKCGRTRQSDVVTGKLTTPFDPGKGVIRALSDAHAQGWGITPTVTWCPACYKGVADN